MRSYNVPFLIKNTELYIDQNNGNFSERQNDIKQINQHDCEYFVICPMRNV